jgi:hypothetical protein
MNNNMVHQNHKRNYNQLINNIEENANVDKNFQTPLPNVGNMTIQFTLMNQMNEIIDINELKQVKKWNKIVTGFKNFED